MDENLLDKSPVKLGITAPTAKARFDRLVNIGFLKSISPVFDFTKVENDPNSGIIKTKQST